MHQNLLTTFSLDEKLNDLSTLKGYQQLTSDFANGTFFSIYGKMDIDKSTNQPKGLALYLQNFRGAITYGLLAPTNNEFEIDFAFDDVINEFAYCLSIYVLPLYYNSHMPKKNEEKIDKEILKNGEKLETYDFKFKNILGVDYLEGKNETEIVELGIPKDKYLEMKQKDYKKMLNPEFRLIVNFVFCDYNASKKINIEKDIFVDGEFYERYGERITPKDDNVSKDVGGFYNYRLDDIIGIENGRYKYNDRCKAIYAGII